MTYPVGKVAFDAKKANRLFFTGDGQLWVQPFWGDPFVVDAEGTHHVPSQPSRAQILFAKGARATLRSDVVLEEDGAVLDEVWIRGVTREGAATDPSVRIARAVQGGAVVRHVVADERVASVLEDDGGRSTLSLWSLARGERVARHEVDASVRASAIAGDSVICLDGDVLRAFPLDGGAPREAKVEAVAHPRAFEALGGTVRLPAASGVVLVQSLEAGTLSLHGSDGRVLFRHGGGGYLARSLTTSVASLSPSGASVVAAVGMEAVTGTAAIEVFDRSGALVRRIEWKCGKSETAYDVAIDDAGWIALATTHRVELFAPEGHAPAKKAKKK